MRLPQLRRYLRVVRGGNLPPRHTRKLWLMPESLVVYRHRGRRRLLPWLCVHQLHRGRVLHMRSKLPLNIRAHSLAAAAAIAGCTACCPTSPIPSGVLHCDTSADCPDSTWSCQEGLCWAARTGPASTSAGPGTTAGGTAGGGSTSGGGSTGGCGTLGGSCMTDSDCGHCGVCCGCTCYSSAPQGGCPACNPGSSGGVSTSSGSGSASTSGGQTSSSGSSSAGSSSGGSTTGGCATLGFSCVSCCLAGSCVDGVCCLPDGASGCESAEDCCSGNCEETVCKSSTSGTTTGGSSGCQGNVESCNEGCLCSLGAGAVQPGCDETCTAGPACTMPGVTCSGGELCCGPENDGGYPLCPIDTGLGGPGVCPIGPPPSSTGTGSGGD